MSLGHAVQHIRRRLEAVDKRDLLSRGDPARGRGVMRQGTDRKRTSESNTRTSFRYILGRARLNDFGRVRL
ncbi:MAG TPA: hypothetical protein VKV02_06045 [Acidobacteriaceae bacterium]|nr:hypothetical protein [Acidobacteriaceae bacterium]